MFTKILVPADGSDNSYRALEAALVFSEKLGSSISVVNVMEQVPITHIESEKLLNELLEAYKKKIKKYYQNVQILLIKKE